MGSGRPEASQYSLYLYDEYDCCYDCEAAELWFDEEHNWKLSSNMCKFKNYIIAFDETEVERVILEVTNEIIESINDEIRYLKNVTEHMKVRK